MMKRRRKKTSSLLMGVKMKWRQKFWTMCELSEQCGCCGQNCLCSCSLRAESSRGWESRACTKLMLFSLHRLLVGSILDIWEPLPAFSELLAEKPSSQLNKLPRASPEPKPVGNTLEYGRSCIPKSCHMWECTLQVGGHVENRKGA